MLVVPLVSGDVGLDSHAQVLTSGWPLARLYDVTPVIGPEAVAVLPVFVNMMLAGVADTVNVSPTLSERLTAVAVEVTTVLNAGAPERHRLNATARTSHSFLL